MSPESTFRAIIDVGYVAVLGIGLYHRIKSWASREPLDRRQEGAFILATLRPAGLLLWVAVLVCLIRPARMAWSAMPLPDWLRWTGVGLFAASVMLFTWTLVDLGPNLTDTVVTRRDHTLVTRGPYQWVRHPFYDAMALLVLGTGLALANWFVLMMGAIVFVLLAVRSRTEEANLLARFGEAYRGYRENTGRFLPRLRRPQRAA